MATFDDFMKLDIRVGTIVEAKVFEKAKKPAYQLVVDFGEEIGMKKSSAQITQQYLADELVGKQVLAVVNFPPRQIANFMSEVLVLGTYSEGGVVLIIPDKEVTVDKMTRKEAKEFMEYGAAAFVWMDENLEVQKMMFWGERIIYE